MTFRGQPQFRPIDWQTAMYAASRSGRSSLSTLMQTKVLIHKLGYFFVLKAFFLHNMAPVAS